MQSNVPVEQLSDDLIPAPPSCLRVCLSVWLERDHTGEFPQDQTPVVLHPRKSGQPAPTVFQLLKRPFGAQDKGLWRCVLHRRHRSGLLGSWGWKVEAVPLGGIWFHLEKNLGISGPSRQENRRANDKDKYPHAVRLQFLSGV